MNKALRVGLRRTCAVSKIYSQARVKHATTHGGWMGMSLVADRGGGDPEPRGEALVHSRLPKIMRTDLENKFSNDFKENAKPKLGVVEGDGGRRF